MADIDPKLPLMTENRSMNPTTLKVCSAISEALSREFHGNVGDVGPVLPSFGLKALEPKAEAVALQYKILTGLLDLVRGRNRVGANAATL